MNPTSVFPSRRPVRSTGIPAAALIIPSLLAAAALILPVGSSAFAQAPGSIDTYFNPTKVAASIYALVYENYGTTAAPTTIFAGGDNGFVENLQPADGSIRYNFVSPTYGSAERIIFTAVPERFTAAGQPAPKLLVGGLFGQSPVQVYLNEPGQNIARVLLDGTQDSSFAVGAGANNYVTSILPLSTDSDSKILVGGTFTSFDLEPRLRIVRLNNNGSIDNSFNLSSQIDGDVLALAQSISPTLKDENGVLLPDDKTLVAGAFNHVGGQPVTKLARLDAAGNLDPTFKPVINGRVIAITVQPTSKIIVGGEFTNINGVPVSRIARLNYDGSLDTTFACTVSGAPVGGVDPVSVYVFAPLKNGKIYVGGNFTQIDGVTRRYLGLINPNGTVGAFDPGVTIYDEVQSLFVQPNGRVLVGETLGPKIGKTYIASFIRLFGATITD